MGFGVNRQAKDVYYLAIRNGKIVHTGRRKAEPPLDSVWGFLKEIFYQWDDGNGDVKLQGWQLRMILEDQRIEGETAVPELYIVDVKSPSTGTKMFAAHLPSLNRNDGDPYVRISTWPGTENSKVSCVKVEIMEGGDWKKCEREQLLSGEAGFPRADEIIRSSPFFAGEKGAEQKGQEEPAPAPSPDLHEVTEEGINIDSISHASVFGFNFTDAMIPEASDFYVCVTFKPKVLDGLRAQLMENRINATFKGVVASILNGLGVQVNYLPETPEGLSLGTAKIIGRFLSGATAKQKADMILVATETKVAMKPSASGSDDYDPFADE